MRRAAKRKFGLPGYCWVNGPEARPTQAAQQELGNIVMVPDGLIVYGSRFGPEETMDRLAAGVAARGLSVHLRVDHATAAAMAGLALQPTEVIIFGSPLMGTLLMQATQTVGIDLPLKALVWQDRAGDTWLGYNDPGWLVRRHGTVPRIDIELAVMAEALATLAVQATGTNP